MTQASSCVERRESGEVSRLGKPCFWKVGASERFQKMLLVRGSEEGGHGNPIMSDVPVLALPESHNFGDLLEQDIDISINQLLLQTMRSVFR
jgi:hypothetical protein